jgi:hypothetical protein
VVQLEKDDHLSTITATWENSGCSCNCFEEFNQKPYKYEPSCIPQEGKWYRLENGKTEMDISIENENHQTTIELLQQENQKLNETLNIYKSHYSTLSKKQLNNIENNKCSIL